MTEPASCCRLYLITPPVIADVGAFADTLARTLAAGDVAALQIRLKAGDDSTPADADTVRRAVDVLRPIAWDHDVAVLLNDHPELVRDTGCDGVHLGQDDMPCLQARKLLGEDVMIGITCHDSRHLALVAAEQGAKTRATSDILTWWQEITTVPCVAIGGITPANAAPLIAAGADFLAVCGGVWAWPEGPQAAVQSFNRLFQNGASV